MYGRLRFRMMRSKSRDTDRSLISRKVDRLKLLSENFSDRYLLNTRFPVDNVMAFWLLSDHLSFENVFAFLIFLIMFRGKVLTSSVSTHKKARSKENKASPQSPTHIFPAKGGMAHPTVDISHGVPSSAHFSVFGLTAVCVYSGCDQRRRDDRRQRKLSHDLHCVD